MLWGGGGNIDLYIMQYLKMPVTFSGLMPFVQWSKRVHWSWVTNKFNNNTNNDSKRTGRNRANLPRQAQFPRLLPAGLSSSLQGSRSPVRRLCPPSPASPQGFTGRIPTCHTNSRSHPHPPFRLKRRPGGKQSLPRQSQHSAAPSRRSSPAWLARSPAGGPSAKEKSAPNPKGGSRAGPEERRREVT